MKATPALLKMVADAEKDGRVAAGPAVNAAALLGHSDGGQHPNWEVGKVSEKEFQQQVVAYAKSHGWTVASIRPARIQRKGGEVYHATPMGDDGVGWPDLFMVKGYRAVVAELKVKPNKANQKQKDWLLKLGRIGSNGRGVEAVPVYAAIWYPSDWPEIVEVLK